MTNGSCHCQSVKYRVDSIKDMWHCHCQTCRKTHSAQKNTAALVDRSDFHLLEGENLLSRYESMPGKFRHFCSKCGAHIYAEFPEKPFVVLRAGSLDEDPGIRVSKSVWLDHEKPWLTECNSEPKYKEGPP